MYVSPRNPDNSNGTKPAKLQAINAVDVDRERKTHAHLAGLRCVPAHLPAIATTSAPNTACPTTNLAFGFALALRSDCATSWCPALPDAHRESEGGPNDDQSLESTV